MKVWGRPPSLLKLEYWEEVGSYQQIIHKFCVAARDCAHCTAFERQYGTFGGVQYFKWCGSRENKLFLQSIPEIHVCIRYCWQAKALTKLWYLKTQLGSSCCGGERCLQTLQQKSESSAESPSEGSALSADSSSPTKQRHRHGQRSVYPTCLL